MQEIKIKLQQAIAEVIKENRTKSITKSSDEIGLGKSIWSDIENAKKDPQISTIWRISEGLNMKPHELVLKIEEKLGDNFSFLEDSL